MTNHTNTLYLQPEDNTRLMSLCGEHNSNIQQIESQLSVKIISRGNAFVIHGNNHNIQKAEATLKQLYDQTHHDPQLSNEQVFMAITNHSNQQNNSTIAKQINGSSVLNGENETAHKNNEVLVNDNESEDFKRYVFNTPKMKITGQNPSQRHYIRQMLVHDISFGIGPAGTGKTFLAVACAVAAYSQHEIKRIVLVRPAVEAGEKLGFLPGDIGQKVDPYLRPLYDAMYDMLGVEKVAKLIEKNVIEIAPLAYMRGRTLNDAAVILDEAQNTTVEQMKMFLTRVGFGSKAMITGDLTQIDLPKNIKSGLRHASEVLEHIDEIGFTYFNPDDVVRHPLVQRIVKAYELYDKKIKQDNHPNHELAQRRQSNG